MNATNPPDQNSVNIFQFETGPVQTYLDENNAPWFSAEDVCAALGYVNPRDALIKHVDQDDVAKRDTIDNLSRPQQQNYINESGLYSLILRSRKPAAKRFKKWVTSEVLPTIRKTGRYESPPAMITSTHFHGQLDALGRLTLQPIPKDHRLVSADELRALGNALNLANAKFLEFSKKLELVGWDPTLCP